MRDAITAFLRSLSGLRASRTISTYRTILETFAAFCASRGSAEPGFEDVELFLARARADGRARAVSSRNGSLGDATTDGAPCPSTAPLRCFGDGCIDPKTDVMNCGGCGIACGTGLTCAAGLCKKPGCASAVDCDDGLNCTIDICNAGACSHTIGPNAGATACPSGQFCVMNKGCVKGKACATNADCADSDPCTTNETCDAATSICTYAVLDKDHDGHAPQVCGGDDCNDSDPMIHPGAPEVCDGKDNGCTGSVDVGATCSDPLQACQAGTCSCKPENVCGSTCTDKNTDVNHCGTCANFCTSTIPSSKCVAGACTCDPADQCGGKCVSLKYDSGNCGACGKTCPKPQYCEAGVCDCPSGSTLSCPGGSVLFCQDPANCGDCGMSCGAGTCVKGVCVCGAGLATCSGTCANLGSDRNNCGTCGHACALGSDCACGTCVAGWKPQLDTCGAVPTDLNCDAANCGRCGTKCSAGLSCIYGACH